MSANEEELFEAFARGDCAAVSAILQEIPTLSKAAIELMGQLFGKSDVLGFPYRLKASRRYAGKPSDALATSARDFLIVHAVKAYNEQHHCKKEAGVQHASEKYGLTRAKVLAALKRLSIK